MSYYPEEKTEIRLPAGYQDWRATRRSRRRVRRIATVAVLGLALVVGVNARSWAHTVDLQAHSRCVNGQVKVTYLVNSQPGDYRFAGTASDSEGHSAPVSIGAGGGSASGELGPVTTSGEVRVVGDFYKESGRKAEHMDRSNDYPFLADCKPETTTTTPTPTTIDQPTPTTAPEVGTPTNQHRAAAPPDQHGTPTEKKAPPVTRPPLNQLPFTGPEHPLGMNDLQWAAFLVALGMVTVGGLMLVAGRRRYQRMLRSVEPVEPSWGEARVRPDRDSADTNLLTTCFHRFHR